MNGTRFNYEDYAWQPPAPQAGDNAYFFAAVKTPVAPQPEPQAAFVAKPQDGVLHRPVGELIADSVLSKPVGDLIADSVLSRPVSELLGRKRRDTPGAA